MTLTVWRIKGKKNRDRDEPDQNKVNNSTEQDGKSGYKKLIDKIFG